MIYEQMFYGGIAGALLFLVLSFFCFRRSAFFRLSAFKREERRRKRQSREHKVSRISGKKRKEEKKKKLPGCNRAEAVTMPLHGQADMRSNETEVLDDWKLQENKATEVLDSRGGMQEFLVEFREICVHTGESVGV